MATGTVSSVSNDVWQLIDSRTPTSGTSVSFTSVSGYKKLMVTLKNVTKGSSASFYITINSDTTGGNYSGTGGFLTFGSSTAAASGGLAVIENVNQAVPHIVSTNTTSTNIGAYVNPVAITSVQIWSDTPTSATVAFTGGTVALYGIAA